MTITFKRKWQNVLLALGILSVISAYSARSVEDDIDIYCAEELPKVMLLIGKERYRDAVVYATANIEKDFKNDTVLIFLLSKAYYQLGNLNKAETLLFDGLDDMRYLCSPSIEDKYIHVDLATIYYRLYEISMSKGNAADAGNFLAQARSELKKYYNDRFSKENEKKLFRMVSITRKGKYLAENHPDPSPAATPPD